MPRNEVAGVLHAEPALEHRFPKVAGHGRQTADQADQGAGLQAEHYVAERGHRHARARRGDEAANEPGPCLVGREARPQLRPLERASYREGRDICRPSDHEQQHRPLPAFRHPAEPNQADDGNGEINHAKRSVGGPLGHASRHQRGGQSAKGRRPPGQGHMARVRQERARQDRHGQGGRDSDRRMRGRHGAPLNGQQRDRDSDQHQE